MIDFNKISDIFCLVDEFCKDFDKSTQHFILGKPSKRPPVMSKSEVISICLLFHPHSKSDLKKNLKNNLRNRTVAYIFATVRFLNDMR